MKGEQLHRAEDTRLDKSENMLVIGAGGAIGQAMIAAAAMQAVPLRITAISSREPGSAMGLPANLQEWLTTTYDDAAIIRTAAALREGGRQFRYVVICTGQLHDDKAGLQPEKKLEELHTQALLHCFHSNAVVPQLWLAALLPVLQASGSCNLAVLSARVGSIGDNRAGGWYSYRASKAALNMLLQTTAVEYARRAPQVKLLAYHPGTVDSVLSKPFQGRVPEGKLFTPLFTAQRLLALLQKLPPDGKLSFLDWNSQPIAW